MKNLIPIAITACFLTASCQQPSEQKYPETLVVPKFLSQTFLSGKLADANAKDFSSDLFNGLIEPVVNKAVSGEIEVFTAYGAPWEKDLFMKMTKAEVARKFLRSDTMYIESPEPPYDLKMTVRTDTSEMDKVIALRAYERWQVDSSFRLSKEVSAYTFVAENIDATTGEVRGLEPKFTVEGEFDSSTKKKVATVRYAQSIDDFQSADVWYKFNLEHSVRERIFSGLLEAAANADVEFYEEPDESSLLTKEGVNRLITFVDTQYIESPEPEYELQMIVIEELIYWDQITEIEFVQDVYVDANFNLHYDVKWYAPRAVVIDRATGENTGVVETLFWVKCS